MVSLRKRTPEARHAEYLRRRDKALAYVKRYATEKPEVNREASRRYRRNNPTKRLDTIYRYRYGWSLDEIEALARWQEHRCASCRKIKRLYVDHDHRCCGAYPTCGRCLLGLVCNRCNTQNLLRRPNVQSIRADHFAGNARSEL